MVAPLLERMPWWTLGLLSALLIAQCSPGTADFLVYDRAAVSGGELWRMVTGHFVHFSASHLLNNLVVLLPAVWLVETRYRRDVGPLFVGAASAIGVAIFVGEPHILQFGGASGISLAFLCYACLRGLHEGQRWRMVCMILLAVICAKFAAEWAGWHLRDWQENESFVPVMLSHVVGAATGAAVYLWRGLGGHEEIPAALQALTAATLAEGSIHKGE